MKVCDVVLDSVWYDPRVRKQIQGYLANGIDLHVIGLEDNRYNKDEIDKLGCNITIVPAKYTKSRVGLLRKLLRIYTSNSDIVKAITETKPDIIHANDLNALLPAYIASRKVRAKLIYDTHEIFIENIDIASNRLLHFFWSKIEKYLIKKIDMLVCVSHAAAEYLSQKYNVSNYMVVTNCCSQVDIIIESSKEKHDGFEIINHGQFYEGRGYDMMIQAARYSSDSNICYALRGFGKMEEELRSDVDKFKLSNVKFYPPVKVVELITYAARSHVGLAITIPFCLNFKLSISNKIFEYAAAGLPVIMSNIPEHKYLNDKYRFGVILENNTPEALHAAVMRLYEDQELYRELSQNALYFSKIINWDNEFLKLVEFEKSILK